MLVEIPEPEVILGVILAFIVGIVGMYAYFKLQPFVKSRGREFDATASERLEYYERQLIDMKIRLDALEIQGVEQKEDPNLALKELLEKVANNQVQKPEEDAGKLKVEPKGIVPEPSLTNSVPANPIDHVLHLITDKAMTSRDICDMLNKTREHTSRVMKKLFEEGYVHRHTESKPYTYSITEKGMAKVTKSPVAEEISQ